MLQDAPSRSSRLTTGDREPPQLLFLAGRLVVGLGGGSSGGLRRRGARDADHLSPSARGFLRRRGPRYTRGACRATASSLLALVETVVGAFAKDCNTLRDVSSLIYEIWEPESTEWHLPRKKLAVLETESRSVLDRGMRALRDAGVDTCCDAHDCLTTSRPRAST